MNSPEPTVRINQQWLPLSDATVPIADLGLWGLAATEMLRTWRGRAVLLDRHIDRLMESAQAMRFDDAPDELPSKSRLKSLVEETIQRNQQLVDVDGDLGVSVCVSSGVNPWLMDADGAESSSGTVSIAPFKLPLDEFRARIQSGQHLVVSSVRQIPEACLPGHIKSRSRLHWRLAEIDVRRQHADAIPLLLDEHDRITETSTSNVFLVKGQTLLTPATNVLNGITRAVVLELAKQSGVETQELDLTSADVATTDEVFTTSSLLGLCPVSRFNSQSLDLIPGTITRQLTDAFNQYVGVDIVRRDH